MYIYIKHIHVYAKRTPKQIRKIKRSSNTVCCTSNFISHRARTLKIWLPGQENYKVRNIVIDTNKSRLQCIKCVFVQKRQEKEKYEYKAQILIDVHRTGHAITLNHLFKRLIAPWAWIIGRLDNNSFNYWYSTIVCLNVTIK